MLYKPVNIMIGLLPDSQCLAANEKDAGIQLSLICTVMYTHLKLHGISFGALWPIFVPYLYILCKLVFPLWPNNHNAGGTAAMLGTSGPK